MNVAVAVVVAVSSGLWTAGQMVPPGLEIVAKVEARRLPGEEATALSTKFIDDYFPDGSVEMRLMTDGRAVRSTTKGRMLDIASGTVYLAPAGGLKTYVLNDADQTYYVFPEHPGTLAGRKPAIALQQTGVFKDVLGYKAQKVIASFQLTVPLRGTPPPGAKTTLEHFAETESWCTSALKVPAAMAKMMDVTQPFLRAAAVQYSKACPVPLQSITRNSATAGFEIVSTVLLVRRLKQVPAGVLELPRNYREIPRPGGGTSK